MEAAAEILDHHDPQAALLLSDVALLVGHKDPSITFGRYGGKFDTTR